MKLIEREQIHLFFGSLALLAFLSVVNTAHASIKSQASVSCKTNFGEKAFTIEEGTVAFHQTENKAQRSISSVFEARSQKTHKGLRRTLYLNGNKHLIHIENVNNLNDHDDYLAVTSQKGHKMTYPLNCKLNK
tara:strand:+ start:30640 stop:31038 length:399 start_codon:yes stop_codon:yes gene_type:complete